MIVNLIVIVIVIVIGVKFYLLFGIYELIGYLSMGLLVCGDYAWLLVYLVVD